MFTSVLYQCFKEVIRMGVSFPKGVLWYYMVVVHLKFPLILRVVFIAVILSTSSNYHLALAYQLFTTFCNVYK